MKLAQINPVVPDISGSLRLLKEKIESMYLNHSLGKLSRPSQEYEQNKGPITRGKESQNLATEPKKTEGAIK